jgi:hypothetical protein
MIIARISGFTRVAGEGQGYRAMYLRDDTIHDAAQGFDVNAMTVMWVPTEEERLRILAGEPIFTRVLGTVPPPMDIGVGDPATYGW